MKLVTRLFTLVAVALVAFSFTSTEPCNDSKGINLAASTVNWKGAKVTGSHTGTVDLKSGALDFQNVELKGGSFDLDLNTIKNTDLSGGTADKLVGHLKSDDFFGVSRQAIATFVITNVEKTANAGEYNVTGDVNIKGKTSVVTFLTNVTELGATAKFSIDRTKHDIRYGSGSFFSNLGDRTIDDDFDVDVALVFE